MITEITELNLPAYATLSQATCTLQDMAEKSITTQVKIDGQIAPDFSYDWEILFRGEKYIHPLRKPQASKENTSLSSTIDLTFLHWAEYQLKRWFFFTVQPVATGTAVADKYIASVSLNLADFCTLFSQVLSYYFKDAITINLNPDPDVAYGLEPVTVEISYSYLWDVLIKLYELYATRWQIEPAQSLTVNAPANWMVGSFRESSPVGTAWEDTHYESTRWLRHRKLIPCHDSIIVSSQPGTRIGFLQFDAQGGYLGIESYEGTTFTDSEREKKIALDPRTRSIGLIYGFADGRDLDLTFILSGGLEVRVDYDRYVINVGYPATEVSHIFEYGYKGGLLKVERQVQDEDIRNMLLGRGGEQNLPYRYFKDVDPDNPSFPADPDWIPELRNIYFSELRGKTFRDYIRGWKTNPRRQLTETDGTPITPYPHDDTVKPLTVEPYDFDYGERNFAYKKGHEDESFNPIEYVKDDESIRRYGPLMGGLDNNEDIYPTIQKVASGDHLDFFGEDFGRVDEAVYIEPILSDDVQDAVESDAILNDVPSAIAVATKVAPHARATVIAESDGTFSVPKGMKANLSLSVSILSIRKSALLNLGKEVDKDIYGKIEGTPLIKVYPVVNGVRSDKAVSASGIGEGAYCYTIEIEVHNLNPDHSFNITVGTEDAKLTSATLSDKWRTSWYILVKNLWGTEKAPGETDAQYAQRVWAPILGDRTGSEAKVVFSDGLLSTSEDYEFIITDFPEYVEELCEWETVVNGQIVKRSYKSHWKIPLGKSDADLESTGLYLPSTMRNASAGDHFFFTGIDMPHAYVLWAEQSLDNYKTDQLDEVKDIKPTWVIGLDKIRINKEQEDEARTLISELEAGASIRLADKRFILNESGGAAAYETLYLQSITYTFQEATQTSAALLPDVEVVLSDKYETSANPVSTLSSQIDTLSSQLGSISNIEQIVRAVGDKLYLRKDGIPDRSMSPTEFASLLTSFGFRSGIVGGAGWGIFKDANGSWVLETDRINVRQDMQVNNLVVNQITARGGMIVESAASMEVSRVEKNAKGEYICYFDEKEGSVANLFRVDDIGWCTRFTAENEELKFYKRRIVNVSQNSVTLAAEGVAYLLPDGRYAPCVLGTGVPAEGDVIVQWGNYMDKSRQFAKIRDVMDGGYERYLEGLDSVQAEGVEYYFVGRQAGAYNDRPRWFVGDAGSSIEYRDGKFNLNNVTLSINSSIGDTTIGDFIKDAAESGAPYQLLLSEEMRGVACDADGTPLSAQLPINLAFRVAHGTKYDTGWKYGASATECVISSIATSTENLGLVSVVALKNADTASVVITATKDGLPELSATFNLYKVKPGQAGEDAVIFSIETSVSNITRAADGSLSADTLTVYKCKTTGSSRAYTSQKSVVRQFHYADGTMEERTILPTGTSTATVAVPDECSAIVFILFDDDGVTVLDRVRIPILDDASGLVLSGDNLLLNSDFIDGTNHWLDSWGAQYTSVDSTYSREGRASLKLEISGLSADAFYISSQTVQTTESVKTYGGSFTLSFYAMTAYSGSQTVIALLRFRDATGALLRDQTLDITSQLKRNAWTYFKLTAQAPVGAASVIPIFRIVRNGCVIVNSPKLEAGRVATPWTPSPLDGGYLRKALRESTEISGGLILTSHVSTGYTDKSGNRVTMAGVNGIYDETKPGNGIAIWGGGDAVDAEEQGAGTGDKARPATMLFRQDGTGYAAKNVIKFEEDRVRVGDGVIMDSKGFALEDENGEESLRISNADLPTFREFLQALRATISMTINPTLTVIHGVDGFTISNFITRTCMLGTQKKGYEIKAVVNFSFNVNFTTPTDSLTLYRKPTMTVSLIKDGTEVISSQQKVINPNGKIGNHLESFNVNHVVATEGSYKIQVAISGTVPTNSPVTESVSSSLIFSGEILRSFPNMTYQVKDGLAVARGTSLFLVNQSEVVMQHNSFAFKLCEDGFKKSTDGGQTWVTANI